MSGRVHEMKARWIWHPAVGVTGYNQTIVVRRSFDLAACKDPRSALLAITADSWYRLVVNGVWVNDGPCRAWPEHYQYDVHDVRRLLKPGWNEIEALARYWGVGNFHTRPQQAGLLAQLDLTFRDGTTLCIATDEAWETAVPGGWIANTPKVSIQMEPQEMFDARAAASADMPYVAAKVLFAHDGGPWRDLQPRDVALLSKAPVDPVSVAVSHVHPMPPGSGLHFCFPAARLANPGRVEADVNVIMAGGVATVVSLRESAELKLQTEGLALFVDGVARPEDVPCCLAAGDHLLLAFVSDLTGHAKEKWIRFQEPPSGLTLSNPLAGSDRSVSQCDAEVPPLLEPACPQAGATGVGAPRLQSGGWPWPALGGATTSWCWLAFPEYRLWRDDLVWCGNGPVPGIAERVKAFQNESAMLGRLVRDAASFRACLGPRARALRADELLVDTHWRFTGRRPDEALPRPIEGVWPLTVPPQTGRDVELCLDMGVQTIGYYEFDIEAQPGVELDVYAVEYVQPDGAIQHTHGNRNGFTYICRGGRQAFLSTKRRSGRYLYITLRNQHAPVTLHRFRVIESTYPVERRGAFRCSDERLGRVWEIAERTLKLCMEDTLTDCPLYEQTHWVGDARNEALYAFVTFGAEDLARRCIRLTAQSLERFPIVGCQTPSGWDVLLPAWSFLWGISVWDYYFHSGDREFLRELWPAVLQNLRGAERHCTDRGLFSGPYWNLFDWAGQDYGTATVLHNSMLLMGAIRAAEQCAAVLGDESEAAWLNAFREQLTASIAALWNPAVQAYPDCIRPEGTPSKVISQHTSFLALLYGIADASTDSAVRENVVNPREGMVRVGSPFAMQYYYEALEKIGEAGRILKSIYDAYLPMLEAGATTVWETFPGNDYSPKGFPTRSHCHAWSSAPLYFLSRIVLGVRPVAPGGAAFEISPCVDGLDWAEGAVSTIRGNLHIVWRKEAGRLVVRVRAPEGVDIRLADNPSLHGWVPVVDVERESVDTGAAGVDGRPGGVMA